MSNLSQQVIDSYIPTIGIECHVQLNSKTKLFAPVNNDAREAQPNTLISPLCIGLPGTLPVLNEAVIELAIRAGLALNAKVAPYSKFDRKHYFYPDLPKGYQITQFDEPIILNGYLDIVTGDQTTRVRIERAHLEEDAGKLTHPEGANYSLVDLNRAGTPLLEIVSSPDINSAEVAKAYARELYLHVKFAEVSEADLYHGNMRFDVNISVSKDADKLGTRAEIKNLNSFKAVEKSVEYEILRQIEILESGGQVQQETRGWHDTKQITFSQRSKEEAHDYRYFPEADLPPIVITDQQIEQVKAKLGFLPNDIRSNFTKFGLNGIQIETLLDYPETAQFLAKLAADHQATTIKTIANWLTGEILRMINSEQITWQNHVYSRSSQLVELAKMIKDNQLSSTGSKDVLKELLLTGQNPKDIAEKLNLLQESDPSAILDIVKAVIANNPEVSAQIKNGEQKAVGFLVGQVMKQSAGKANPALANQLILQELTNDNPN